MEYHVLAVGDVVGEQGLAHLERHLRPLQKFKQIAFTVVNGENAASVGLTPDQARRIYDAGADVITLGNHTFGKPQIAEFLDDTPYILRPANFTGRAPGRGCGIFDLGAFRVRVVNLIGRCDLNFNADNPFITAEKLLAGRRPLLRWWTSMPRRPAKSWPWAIIWTGGSPLCGDPHPCAHRRRAGVSQGNGLSHRSGHDRAGGIRAGYPAGAVR